MLLDPMNLKDDGQNEVLCDIVGEYGSEKNLLRDSVYYMDREK